MRLGLVVAAAAALIAAPATGSAAITLRATSLRGEVVRGDDVRYLAAAQTQTSPAPPVTVLDTHTGATTLLAVPSSCGFADIHHATVLSACRPSEDAAAGYGTAMTLDMRTRLTAMLPLIGSTSIPGVAAFSSTYTRIGDRWAEASALIEHAVATVYIRRSTAAVTRLRDDGRSIPDLDADRLRSPLCDGLWLPTVPDDQGFLTSGDLVRHGTRAAVTTYLHDGAYAEVQLQRCGRKTRTLRRCRDVHCSQPVIAGELVVWSERGRAPNHHRSRLVAYSTRTARMQRSAWHRTTLAPIAVGAQAFATLRGRVYRVRAR